MRGSWKQFGLAFIGTGCLVALIAAYRINLIQSHEGALRGMCTMHMKQIALALLNYHDDYGELPTGILHDNRGVPTHSWRVLILPYLDNAKTFATYRLQEPWNSPANQVWHDDHAKDLDELFHCPTNEAPHPATNYVAVVGPRTLWENSAGKKFFGPGSSESDEILFIEAPGLNFNWLEPRDINVGQAIEIISKSPPIHPLGIRYIDASQRMGYFPKEASPQELRRILERSPQL